MPSPLPTAARHLWVRGLLVAALLLSGLVAAPPAALSQETPALVAVDMRLVSQPIWHKPTDPLGLKLRIVNRMISPLDGFLISLATHPLASTRSALHESFEGNAGAVTGARSETFEQVIEAGGAVEIDIPGRVGDLESLAALSDGGVYPMTVTLFDINGAVQYDSLTTPLIIYPDPPEVPLNLAMVLPLNALPNRRPDGVFASPTGATVIPIEDAVAETGWLQGAVDAIAATSGELPPVEKQRRVVRGKGKKRRTVIRTVEVPRRGLHLGLAPAPRLIEEVADLSDGYQRVAGTATTTIEGSSPVAQQAAALIERLSGLLQEDGIQPLLVPYSFPDLPALARNLPDRIDLELDEATDVLSDHLGLDLERDWLFPPAGRLGSETLDELRLADADTARHTIFQAAAFEEPFGLEPEGCPVEFASFACPVRVRTPGGPTDGLVADDALQERLAAIVARSGGRLDLQNFFAETAAIRQEVPSIENRVVHVTVPSLWHPAPGLAMELFTGLRNAPWLRTVTPAEAVELRKPVLRSDAFVQTVAPLSSEPDVELFAEVSETEVLLDSFRRMQPPEQLARRLRRNLLVAESRLWWPDQELIQTGQTYLSGTRDAIFDELGKITIRGPDEINLTAREGEIPLVVANRTDFSTTVQIEIDSPQPLDLEVQPESLPPQRIQPQDSFQFTVAATARSSGIFTMEVLVETPDGDLEVATKRISVRSTEFNQVALAVTVGAFAFLVLFYLVRVARRRRRTEGAA